MRFANSVHLVVAAYLVCCNVSAQAAQVRHLFDYTTSQLSLGTAGACGTLSIHSDAVRCNPALQRQIRENFGSIELTTLADEPTFDALWKFATQPLTATDLKALFEKYSFATFSGYVRLATASKWFSFEFIPASLSGAYRLSNPSLPLLQVSGIRKTAFSTNFAIGIKDFYERFPIGIDFGIKLKSEKSTWASAEIDALAAASKIEKNVIQTSKKNDLKTDFGLYLDPSAYLLPKVGLVCVNCLKNESDLKSDLSLEDSDELQVSSGEFRSIKGHMSLEASPGIGTLFISSIFTWGEDFKTYLAESSGGALGYKIGDFSISSQYTPARTGWGFMARRGFYQIGMQYAREKQPAVFQIERQEKLYMTLGASL